MAAAVLILRPQPGADRTAARARALGLQPIVTPLFHVHPVAWTAPDPAAFDAVMLTSANAALHSGPQLGRFTRLPCYVVGETTGDAAAGAGFSRVLTGPADAAALARMIAEAGATRVFHPCGAEHVATPGVDHCVVYRSASVDALPAAARGALNSGALALLHSPRAGSVFAGLCDRAGLDRPALSLAAISEAAALAAGQGWARTAWPERPRDQALLELAVELCNSGASLNGMSDKHGL